VLEIQHISLLALLLSPRLDIPTHPQDLISLDSPILHVIHDTRTMMKLALLSALACGASAFAPSSQSVAARAAASSSASSLDAAKMLKSLCIPATIYDWIFSWRTKNMLMAGMFSDS
jgi:hypothetical protein